MSDLLFLALLALFSLAAYGFGRVDGIEIGLDRADRALDGLEAQATELADEPVAYWPAWTVTCLRPDCAVCADRA